MAIYYLMLEAVPLPENKEEKEIAGAFINCWVNSASMESALTEANDYIQSEGWKVQKVEDQFIVNRERYLKDPELQESLECFDQAVNDGISSIFYVWPSEETDFSGL
ncbi:hypothetical protein QWY22_10975 [Planococcus liqunii]|uniref:hypothetical protein n=1 Tax=Planococcus liqunii TaxID=3058394 RepID=UPI002631D116|nr:hypothetical protein [Planococcus sp. N056]WKA49427.1 hypothetical protein QWY22_10975 [Planococcus sp. N056]